MGAERDRASAQGQSPGPQQTVHGTCVSLDGRALLIRGASGTGKSSLALHMIALGAKLVADDRTRLWRQGEEVIADAPQSIRDQIEARFVGIMRAPSAGPTPLALVVTLDDAETERLPPARRVQLLGVDLPLLRKCGGSHFPAALMVYLRGGRVE